MLKNIWERLAASFRPDNVSLRAALDRCRQRTQQIGTLIDVGASNGSWSIMARGFFPGMACFMIEAQAEHEPALKKLRAADDSFDYIIAAAGDSDGFVHFQEGDLFGGVAVHSPSGTGLRQVPMVRLDSLLRSRSLQGSFLLKLDTHGFEVPILEGAGEVLAQTSLLVVEVYNFQLTPESLRFHEMCAYLENRGFRCIDICDPLFRKKDGALWQMDLFFAPADSVWFSTNSYA
jgi:FkbM family methyltransferase